MGITGAVMVDLMSPAELIDFTDAVDVDELSSLALPLCWST
jgi:hypothetical protein